MGSLEEVLNGLDDMVGLLALKQERTKIKHENKERYIAYFS